MKTYTYILLFWFFTTSIYSQHCISKISAGQGHGIAQKTDGSLIAWGRGDIGALANGTGANEYTPIALATGNNWLFINSGLANTFAIRNDHTLWGAGINENGALGIGSANINTLNWTQIGTANNWAKVSGADYSTIGLKTNGTLWGWGQNVYYQMGNGTCCADEMTPIQIHPDTDWVDIETSQYGVGFAIKNNGTLWGWGSNCSGILVGGSDVPNRPIITQLTPDTNWKSLSAGSCHVLALKTNNTLWAWGGNENGQLGTNDPGTANTYPEQVGTDTWKSIATGFNISFGIKTNGTLWAWGKNDVGQLGLGNTINQTIPMQVGIATDWESVSCGGYDFAIALKTNGSLYTWGQNDFGQLANGTTNPQLVPTMVISCPLSTDSFTSENVSFYPNPAKEQITLQFSNTPEKAIVTVYSMIRAKMHTFTTANKTAYTINTSTYSAGIYIVVVENSNGQTQQYKLIKQ